MSPNATNLMGQKDLSTQSTPTETCSSSCSYEGLLVSTVLMAGMVGCALLIACYLMFRKSEKWEEKNKKSVQSDNEGGKVIYEHLTPALESLRPNFCAKCGQSCNV